MKKFFRTVVGKTILFILTILSGAVSVAAIFAICFMIEETVYSRPQTQVYDEMIQNMMMRDGVEILEDYLFFTEDERMDADKGNLEYEMVDEQQNVVSSSQGSGSSWTYTLYYRVEKYGNGEISYACVPDREMGLQYYAGDTWEDEESAQDMGTRTVTLYTLKCRLKDGLPVKDKYALMYRAVSLGYGLRYSVYVIFLAALAVAVVCFVGLMSVAGRRPDSEEVWPGPLHRIPSDVLAVVDITLACIPLALALEVNSGEVIPFAILNTLSILFCCSVCLGLCMSVAVRIKQHTLLSGSLIGWAVGLCRRVLRFILDGVKKCWRECREVMKLLPFTQRIVAVYVGVTLIEFCLLAADIYFPIWFILHLVAFPLILYVLRDLQNLKEAGKALAQGNLAYQTDTEKMRGDLKEHGENLNSIANGMSIAVEERLKSERMKTELITNVSHDIKTPLTSIINYATLIGAQPCENEKITEYADVLVRQSERLKRLIEDLVEASKASSGNLEVHLTPCDGAVFISQAAGEYEEKLKNAALTLVTKQPEREVWIMADGRRMWRIFDNLMNNICKYAQSGTRVFVTMETVGSEAVFSFKNTSRDELNVSPDELMERFVRGDASRNTEGNGLGLSIARSMAQLQGGTLEISTDADLFKAILRFPLVQNSEIPQ